VNTPVLILLCVVAEITLDICYKVAATRAARIDDRFVTVLLQPPTWAGMALWLVQTLLWVRVLQTTPLTIAFPLMSLVYIGIPLASRVVLKEKMTWRHLLAAGLIAGGVALCAAGGADL
jgi:undecaprenyl phosphate-alpha-L-ara4N flippase subunit ArnE